MTDSEFAVQNQRLQREVARLQDALDADWPPKQGLAREVLDALGERSMLLAPAAARRLVAERERYRAALEQIAQTLPADDPSAMIAAADMALYGYKVGRQAVKDGE